MGGLPSHVGDQVLERARIQEMNRFNVVVAFALWVCVVFPIAAHSQQTLPTATQTLQLSVFGGFGGVFTGLGGGKNFDVLAGADLGLPPVHGIRPTVEVRGAYPVDKGLIDSQKSMLGGIKTEFLLNHHLRPYANFLFGRGQINYNGGYQFGNQIYLLTTTNVYSFGGGFDYDLSDSFSLRFDGQFQKWGYAPTPSGNIYAKVANAAIVYHFKFGRGYR
jgi:hypothetical protein